MKINQPGGGSSIATPVTPANGGTGTSTVFTTGSVVFAGAAGIYAQDNANLFWDDTNNRLGIGGNTPTGRLDVVTNSLGVTQVDTAGLTIMTTTPAAAGAQQISPALHFQAQGWKTTATAASQLVDFREYLIPVQGTTNPSSYLAWEASINGGAYSNAMVLTSSGSIGLGVITPSTKLHVLSTTEQIRTAYDASNYLSTTVSSVGATAFAITGTNAGFTFTGAGTGINTFNSGQNGTAVAANVFNNTSSNATPGVGSFLSPNMATGTHSSGSFMSIGQSNTTQNAGVFQFTFIGAGSNSNYLTMGVYGTAGVLNVFKAGVSIGGSGLNPTALLHLAASTTAASSAPLKFAGGTLMTTQEAGAVEYDSKNLYFTPFNTNGTTRHVIPLSETARVTAQTAAATLITRSVPGTDTSYYISANVLVTTSSAENFTVTCAYTDEGNTARTVTLNFSNLGGTIGSAINFANGAVPYEGIPLHIRAKANTSVTIATTGTFTGAIYNGEGTISQNN